MYDYDPGDLPNDDPLEQRRRRRQMIESEVDDAWAAADEDDIPDEAVEIEDLAAGYVDDPIVPEITSLDEPLDGTGQADLGPLPVSAQRLVQERRTNSRYGTSLARKPHDEPEPRKVRLEPEIHYGYGRAGRLSSIPFWGILLLVFLALIALLVVILATASILSLFG